MPGRDEPQAIQSRIERQLLAGEPCYTRAQVAARAGVSLERARALWAALGFAGTGEDDLAFTEADVEALRLIKQLTDSDILDAETETSVARAMSRSLARLAEWQTDIVRELILSRQSGAAAGQETDALLPAIPVMEKLQLYVWRRHLAASTGRMLAQGLETDTTAPELAVGFADIVGFTSLSRGLDEHRLRSLLERFESTCNAVITGHDGRVVKTLGDEVLFVADAANNGARIALQLPARLKQEDELLDVRVGLAHGPVLGRWGDVYGTTVNVASRLTSLARPGTVLADRGVADRLAGNEAFYLKKLRRVSVRGFQHLQPWVLRQPRQAKPRY